jgi:NIPSNAP
MIYEFRTYTLHPRMQPEFLKRFAEKLPGREKYSKLTAMWTTEIGPLNQVIHVWGYENALERSKIRTEAVKAGAWPPNSSDLIQDMKSEIFEPLPFSPPLTPSNHGPYFEMRSYALKPGGIPQTSETWAKHLPARLKFSPLIGVFTSDIGGLNQWVHIWAYKSLDERAAVRKKAVDAGVWPPPSTPDKPSATTRQESKIMMAASFSPIK